MNVRICIIIESMMYLCMYECVIEKESQGRSSVLWKTTKIKGDSQALSQVDFLEENLSLVMTLSL